MYLHKTPFLLKKLYPSLVWNESSSYGKTIYLTFDDGPIPEVTEYVLEELNKFSAKATFFCVGENIRKNENIFKKLVDQKHSVGNHTYNHLNGFKTSLHDYLENIKKCEVVIDEFVPEKTRLFRPPYGRIRKEQIKSILPDYKIIMWDVLSGDFDKSLSAEKCLKAVTKHTVPGSILVFHDSVKTYSTLKFVLPKMLSYFKEEGFRFQKLDCGC